MKKIKISIASSIAVLSLLFLVGGAFADDIYSSQTTEYSPPMGLNTFEASWLIGHSVSAPTSETAYLGQISNLVVDRENGRIVLAILSDVPHLGSKQVAVPFGSLKRIGPDTFALSFGDRTDKIPIQGSNQVGSTDEDIYISYMSSASSGSDLYGVPEKIDPNWVAEIYRHYGQVPYWDEKGGRPLNEMGLMRTSMFMGADVSSPRGEARARVNDFVIDASDGHVTFVVLSDIPGRPDTLVAVPFDTLGRGDNAFALDLTGDKLASAPKFDEYGDMNNATFAENVYRYFGVQPYWTGGM